MSTSAVAQLQACLDSQREHVLGILDGLDEAALRRPVLPSGWSCLGLVQHLAIDIERFWFRAVVAGEQPIVDAFIANPGDAWQVAEDVSFHDVLDSYRAEIDQSNDVIAATPLDAAPSWWPAEQFGDFRMDALTEILLHVIAETACHAGHLDAARELIDGRAWMVLD